MYMTHTTAALDKKKKREIVVLEDGFSLRIIWSTEKSHF